MASVFPLTSSVGCSACRRSALRLFVDGFATNQVRRSTPWAPLSATGYQPPAHHIKSYSGLRTTPTLRGSPSIEEYATKDNDTASQPSESEADVPWYLQVEPPKHPALLHEPPPLPDIPEGSPNLMEPLVKFVSDELGLDDLNLLDLRELDPPAAIGPDLLMLFGTARSERHLHVSADRLVRFLRGRGIHAKADGLIGRNVLKTRLRRKARKEKLLGSSGVTRGGDDGITTGWICVNVGTVGRSDVEIEILDEDGNSTGFGVPRMGTTVVVQMMTESRRQELNLEKLWSDKLRRGLERNNPRPAGTGPPRNSDNSSRPFSSGKRTGGSQDKYQPGSSSSNRRYFSTAPSRHQSERNAILAKVVNWDITSPATASEAQILLERDHDTKLYVLSQLQSLLARQIPTDRAAHLSNPSLSPIMQLYHRALAGLSPSTSFPSRLSTEVLGRTSGIPSYTLENLRSLFREAQLTAQSLSRSEYLAILRAVFSIPGGTHAEVQDQSNLAMEVIDCMFVRGDASSSPNISSSVMDNDVMIAIIQGLVARPALVQETRRLLAQFEEFLFQTPNRPCPSEKLLISLLESYANAGEWNQFWKTWRIPPQRYIRRSSEMYTYLFRRFAEDGHRVRALQAVRWCFEEMAKEVPRVTPIGEVRDALEMCLRVADPSGESVARSVPPVSGRNSGFLGERECVRIWHGLWDGKY
ncbi:hypothetical protein V8F33_013608 [Rhypophila sp. PSN 637]